MAMQAQNLDFISPPGEYSKLTYLIEMYIKSNGDNCVKMYCC